jgi:hypothetical protein
VFLNGNETGYHRLPLKRPASNDDLQQLLEHVCNLFAREDRSVAGIRARALVSRCRLAVMKNGHIVKHYNELVPNGMYICLPAMQKFIDVDYHLIT